MKFHLPTNRKLIAALFVFAFFPLSKICSQSLTEKMAQTAMNLWKPGRPVGWSYEQAIVLKGIEGLYHRTGKDAYFDYIKSSIDHYVTDSGTINTYKRGDYNIDNLLGGRNLLFLYKATKDEKYRKAAVLLRQQLLAHPRTNEGGFWHKNKYIAQMWLDGLYMGQPFMAEYAAAFGEDTLFNDIARQFILMERHSRDSKTGLLYHGYDESRQQQWANKTTGRSPHVWARAMGWYGMALVDALEWYPASHPGKDSLVRILNRYAKAVAIYQDKKSGLWWDIVDMGGKEKNYFEASASSMFVYTLLKGARLGYLPSHFKAVGFKGYGGILSHFIKTENNQVHLTGTVSVSGLGGNPYRDGSYDYYMSEKVVTNDPKGVGAFLLAGSEVELLAANKKKK
jgi:unsaturated rhamnogalacturonyl hydrolase